MINIYPDTTWKNNNDFATLIKSITVIRIKILLSNHSLMSLCYLNSSSCIRRLPSKSHLIQWRKKRISYLHVQSCSHWIKYTTLKITIFLSIDKRINYIRRLLKADVTPIFLLLYFSPNWKKNTTSDIKLSRRVEILYFHRPV